METWKAINKSVDDKEKTMFELQLKYNSKAQNNALRPIEVVLGYEIFSETSAQEKIIRIAQLLFGVREEERLALHNWGIFSSWSSNDQMSLGDTI